MSCLEIGQVVWLKIRFNNNGEIARTEHPYLVIDIDDDLDAIEVAQIDSVEGKGQKAFFRSNKIILCTDPNETVISKDSFVQLDNTIKIENCSDLVNYRPRIDKLSEEKLASVLSAYNNYHSRYEIDDNKNVYISREELLDLN